MFPASFHARKRFRYTVISGSEMSVRPLLPTSNVSRLIKSGWDLNEGEAIDGAMFGEVQEMFGENNELIPTGFEVVQLIKTQHRTK
jgi:hypothetical protein